jgi:hypothetical protein
MVYRSDDWLSAAYALLGCTLPFLSRPASGLVRRFSSCANCTSRFEVSIARSCRFMRGARPAATLGWTVPACISAISRATRSRTAIALSTVGRARYSRRQDCACFVHRFGPVPRPCWGWRESSTIRPRLQQRGKGCRFSFDLGTENQASWLSCSRLALSYSDFRARYSSNKSSSLNLSPGWLVIFMFIMLPRSRNP